MREPWAHGYDRGALGDSTPARKPVMSVEQTFKYARGGGMNIGILAMGWTPDVGGIQSHTAGLARVLLERGHQVFVLCLDTSGEHEPFTVHDHEVDGVQVRRVAYQYGDHGQLFHLMYHRGLNDVVLGWMAETPCDLIHVHHVTGFGGGALRAIDDVGQPLVMTLHDYWMLDPRGQLFRPDGTNREPGCAESLAEDLRGTWGHLLPSGGARAVSPEGREFDDDSSLTEAYLKYSLELLEIPRRLIAPSRAAARVFERAGVPEGRVQVVENGVDAGGLGEATRALRASGSAERPLTLGVIGTVLPSKGVLELAQAFVAADVPSARLLIAGNAVPYHGDRSTIDAVTALAEEHANVELRGEFAHADLASLLAELDGVAAPSRWEEVYGLTVREARAAGLPVIVSDRGALPDVTDGGRAGLVVPVDDQQAWVDAIRRFVQDDESRAAWARHPAPVWTTEQMAVELERLYADVVEEATGLRPDGPTEEAEEAPNPPATKPKGFFGRLFGRG